MNIEHMQFGALLDELGAKSPTPGGGAAASAVGALGAALGKMVVSYSVGRKSLAPHEGELASAAERLGGARRLLLDLAAEDAAAYGAVNELMKLPEDDSRRRRELPGAIGAAVQAPRATVAACADLLRLFESLAPITNRALRSDLAIAAILAEAGARASRWNVAVNIPILAGAGRTEVGDPDALLAEVDAILGDARARLARIEQAAGHGP